jgi:hypothetical protein
MTAPGSGPPQHRERNHNLMTSVTRPVVGDGVRQAPIAQVGQACETASVTSGGTSEGQDGTSRGAIAQRRCARVGWRGGTARQPR